VLEIRKHWGDYFKGYPNFKPFRIKLMQAETESAVKEILEEAGRFYT
jgi:tRNA-dihydrouridine synthase